MHRPPGGFRASADGVVAFRRDPANGRLFETGRVALKTQQNPIFACDPANGLLYVGGDGDTLDVIKVAKKASSDR